MREKESSCAVFCSLKFYWILKVVKTNRTSSLMEKLMKIQQNQLNVFEFSGLNLQEQQVVVRKLPGGSEAPTEMKFPWILKRYK